MNSVALIFCESVASTIKSHSHFISFNLIVNATLGRNWRAAFEAQVANRQTYSILVNSKEISVASSARGLHGIDRKYINIESIEFSGFCDQSTMAPVISVLNRPTLQIQCTWDNADELARGLASLADREFAEIRFDSPFTPLPPFDHFLQQQLRSPCLKSVKLQGCPEDNASVELQQAAEDFLLSPFESASLFPILFNLNLVARLLEAPYRKKTFTAYFRLSFDELKGFRKELQRPGMQVKGKMVVWQRTDGRMLSMRHIISAVITSKDCFVTLFEVTL